MSGASGAPTRRVGEHLRWSASLGVAAVLHVAVVVALLATAPQPDAPPATQSDIEVTLVEPVPPPPEQAPVEAPAPTPQPPPAPPPERSAGPVPVAPPAGTDPASPAPPPPQPDRPGPPPAATAPEATPEPPPLSTPLPGPGFEIPSGRERIAEPPPSARASPLPAGAFVPRPQAPSPSTAAPTARLAPLVVKAGPQADGRPSSYPAEARHRQEQGDVLVEVQLDPSGGIRGARIKTSSGHASLDGAALRSAQALRFRAPQPPPGVVLRHVILVEIPFSFRLD